MVTEQNKSNETKRCVQCRDDKPLSGFRKERRVRDGRKVDIYNKRCRICMRKNWRMMQPGRNSREQMNKNRRAYYGLVCEDYIANNMSQKELAAKYNVHPVTISMIIKKYLGNGTPVYIKFIPE